MHELSLATELVRVLERTAGRVRASRVLRARMRIGELTCVNPDALLTALEIASRGTLAEGCALAVDRVPARLRCLGCRAVHGGPLLAPCDACGVAAAEILEGRENWLDSVELDVEEAPVRRGEEGR